MARRNRINQGPLFAVMLLIVAIWMFVQGGAEASLRSPAGMLLLLSLLLIINMFLRKRVRPQHKSSQPAPSLPYGPAVRRPERSRYTPSRPAFSRTALAAQPETWPYDGRYCVHCGLKKREEETLCRRCGELILAKANGMES